MELINEGTAIVLETARRGDDGVAVIPTTLKYRVDCETTGESITAWTSLTPDMVTSLTIPAASNIMRDSDNTYEDRRVTFMSDEGLSTQLVQTVDYRVKNLGSIS